MQAGRLRRTLSVGAAAGTAVALLSLASPAGAAGPATATSRSTHHRGYVQTNLVSDQPGVAQLTDASLVNAWGLSAGPATPLWVSDNGADVLDPLSRRRRRCASQRSAAGRVDPCGAPTGQVFNPTPGFRLPNGSPALFLFAGEHGVLSGWNQAAGTSAVRVARTRHAVYKGLALEQLGGTQRLLAANFHSGRIDVFTSKFGRVHLRGHRFRDMSLPHGYAPFNVAVIGGRVLVTYAKQDAAKA